MAITIIMVPGYTNSGSGHWQSIIENKFKNIVRVEQENWNNPVRENWIEGLQNTINLISGDVFLVGHSCGSITIAQWADKAWTNKTRAEKHRNARIKGALLVAPADVDAENILNEVKVQRPVPNSKLPFKTTLLY